MLSHVISMANIYSCYFYNYEKNLSLQSTILEDSRQKHPLVCLSIELHTIRDAKIGWRSLYQTLNHTPTLNTRVVEARLSDLQGLSTSHTTLPQLPANIATIPCPP